MAFDPVFALSVHADYRCRHSGQCCSTNWDVPIELPIYRTLADAITAGALRTAPAAGSLPPFVVDPELPDEAAAIFERTESGACVFFEPGSRLCLVHRDLGEPAMAATCRHFPRLAVRDRRGTFVTLSHFCPTAASMLFRQDVSLGIVSGPLAFPPADYDGLAVPDDQWPPLLRPGVLMDLDGYTAWEAHMVWRCGEVERDPDAVLATLTRDARRIREWRPGRGSLRDAIGAVRHDPVKGVGPASFEAAIALYRGVLRAIPPEFMPASDEARLDEAFERFVQPAWPAWHAPVNRYIAAKSFASWTAYQGQGIATIVRGLEAAVAVVRVEAARGCRDASRVLDHDLLLEAFRSADFIINHLAVGEDLAVGWSAAEEEG